MAVRDIYLKIEQVAGYSPVEPETKVMPPKEYRRDCMRNVGHENGTIPQSEVDARRLNALVYREYLDPSYLVPKPDKIVPADVNEPTFSRRVPGTVIYASPGDRLRIHVLNGDFMPHSFHLHGLVYGIDSDGSWPFGTQASDGRRSDEICPGQSWTYTFDVTNDTLGAWPFHDHSSGMISESVNRGLFGGIIARPRRHRPFPPLDLPPLVKEFLKKPIRPLPHPIPNAPHPPGPPPPGPMRGGMPMGMPMAPPGFPDRPEPFPDPRPPFDDPRLEIMREYLEDWVHRPEIHVHPRPSTTIDVPLFFHFMSGVGARPAFDSGPLGPAAAPFEATFGTPGTFGYHCSNHPEMQGTVTVAAGNPMLAIVDIRDVPTRGFFPPTVAVGPGGMVRWVPNNPLGAQTDIHTVTENAGGFPSYCLNGRSFIGNTPTILAEAGQRIRWYVFNLDLGMAWHNFHTHAQRWTFGGETMDTRSIGPAESFAVETVAPPPVLLPEAIQATQVPASRPRSATPYRLRGDFLLHCHVEMHMQQGLAGLVRSHQTVWLTPAQRQQLENEIGLPLDPGDNACPVLVPGRCDVASCGRWEEVPDAPVVTMMHSALVPGTTKVLFWGYGRADQTRLWDYGAAPAYSSPGNQPVDVAPVAGDFNSSNLHSAAHAYLADGRLLAHGGETQGDRQSFLFTPGSATPWSRTAATAGGRFYASTLTLADGKLLTLYGTDPSLEVYDPTPGTWSAPKGFPPGFSYVFYPWTYLLPGGDLFVAGHQDTTRRFDWTGTPIAPGTAWTTLFGDRSPGGAEKGTSVLLPLRPPAYAPRVLNAAGSTGTTEKSSEWIDLSAMAPAWTALGNLNVPRPEQCTSVLLPDGRVFIAGGVTTSPGPAEIFDPEHPSAGWQLCGNMSHSRGYHSSAILLGDGSVLMGGDPPGAGGPTPHERFYPSYFFTTRPSITSAPATIGYGASFTVDTPDAPGIAEVVLMRPGAVTHGWNQTQRLVGCAITGGGATSVQATAPPDGTVAPPGPYLLFVLTSGRIPSTGRWITLGP